MIKKLLTILEQRAFIIMIAGFGISVVSLVVYMNSRYAATSTQRIAFGATIAGFAIYVLGRIFVWMQRRTARKAKLRGDLDSKDSL